MAEYKSKQDEVDLGSGHYKSNEVLISSEHSTGRGSKIVMLIGILLIIAALAILLAGIVMIKKAEKKSSEAAAAAASDGCQYSDEALKSGFTKFLTKVRDNYYVHHPANLPYKPGVSEEEVKKSFSMWDNQPEAIKARTDSSKNLLKEINNMKINKDKLKPREKKALYQVKHYLQHVFGQPYEVNYYTGDWMLGPNLFCWQPACYLSYDVKNMLSLYQPKKFNEIETLKKHMQDLSKALYQYRTNMRMGVESGMIRSEEECKAGLDSFSRSYMQVNLKGKEGVLNEWYTKEIKNDSYWEYLSNDTANWNKWRTDHNGENASVTVEQYLVEYVGRPLDDLINYLKTEHKSHCVPSSVASGLGSLPVDYVYTNGIKNNSHPTTKKLPTGENLNGSNSYEMIMSYFTTNSMTPNQVHELGWDMLLNSLYPQVLEVARAVTGTNNNDTAKTKFQQRLNESDMFFARSFPQNESDETAFLNCTSVETAKLYCPVRMAAMEKWFRLAHEAMSMLDPKTYDFFYFTGDYHTTPNCPVEMKPNFNPSSGAQSYRQSDYNCSRTANYNIPFFLDSISIYEEWSVNAHEARPGHHTQVQGLEEHFQDMCGGEIAWIDKETYYTAFTEGWALYAENPLIAQDTDTYKDPETFFQKYGMLKWQVWRALRLIVDTGLHYKGYNRTWALKMFEDYAWDTSDVAAKEVTRYQSDAGQATAYMIGQLQIIKSRNLAKEKLKNKFKMKDFHYQVLSQGSAPLQYLDEHILKYIECVNDKTGEGCDTILGPPKKMKKMTPEKSLKTTSRPSKFYFF